MHLGVASTRLPVSCTYGLGVARRTYGPLGRKADGGRSPDVSLKRLTQRRAWEGTVGPPVDNRRFGHLTYQ